VRTLTHVSLYAHDLDDSVPFYRDLFGMEQIPASGPPSRYAAYVPVSSTCTSSGARAPHPKATTSVYRSMTLTRHPRRLGRWAPNRG
jgi:catechol 2,3-dioxygenase-like lactoylglutathione lyase family enzyme